MAARDPLDFDLSLLSDEPLPRPSAGTYLRHLLLLAVTFCTVTIAGTLFPFGESGAVPDADPQTAAEFVNILLALPGNYVGFLAAAVAKIFTDPATLRYGLSFSLSLLFILICHEMGHYVACRIYRVQATLPFFIPTPPMIGPAGTFGAFIKIQSPMPSRRAVFDIGVAGPIAGFLALIPIAVVAYATLEFGTQADIVAGHVSPIEFSEPLFIKLAAALKGADMSLPMQPNPYYFATWIGLLVTALNLIPSGQLDGGHAIYAALGEKVHRWTGRIAFVVMAVLSIVGFLFYNSPSGFLITIILGVMLRVPHPRPWDQTPLDTKRRAIAFATLLIFVLCFVPFPIRIN
jgi:membrane-associated protease RseP (regulator of RpoE activity)